MQLILSVMMSYHSLVKEHLWAETLHGTLPIRGWIAALSTFNHERLPICNNALKSVTLLEVTRLLNIKNYNGAFEVKSTLHNVILAATVSVM